MAVPVSIKIVCCGQMTVLGHHPPIVTGEVRAVEHASSSIRNLPWAVPAGLASMRQQCAFVNLLTVGRMLRSAIRWQDTGHSSVT